ncbi:MAG TPA: SLBB domain-containing protein [Candidatus Methylomirabilis sp.]|nr:SLBB domain-containing protein [Candidatus Methylomirabilis sp.]
MGPVAAVPSPNRGPIPGQFPAPGFPGIDCIPSEPLSAIEADFEKRVPVELSGQMRQFGYNVFRGPAGTFAPVENLPVGPDYVLGPGDDLTIYIWGAVESYFTATVDRSGEILIPRVGPLKVWGLTFDKAQQLIRDKLSQVFTGFQVSITLGRLRTIQVFLVGEVGLPGAYNVSALSTLTHALFAAGGPTKQGTLRGIKLLRNNQQIAEFDFYDFLLRGDKSQDVRLEPGDIILVPPIGPVVGLVGDVKRPAIYEMKGGMLAADLLTLAGGVSPGGYLQRLQLERFRANTDRLVLDFNLLDFYRNGRRDSNPMLQDGDLVRVFPVDPRIYNVVTLEGFVKRPGNYEFRPGMRVGDLLATDQLLPEAFLDRAELVRLREDLTTEVIPFSIREIQAGRGDSNLELRPRDRVVVNSEFRAGASVLISGQVKRPGRYAINQGERLSSLLERAGGFLPGAFPKGAVFTRESIRQIERQQLDKFIQTQDQTLMAEVASGVEGAAALNVVRRELARSLASVITLGRLSVQLDSPERIKAANDILLEDGDSLSIPQQPTSVFVIGAVRNSASILFKEGENIEYYLSQAGGTRPEAEVKQTYILKADGTAVASFVKLRKLEPGDAVVVPISVETKINWVPFLRDMFTIVAQAVIPIGVIGGLLK